MIIVAGRAAADGQREMRAMLPIQHDFQTLKSNANVEPKRKQEINLSMEDVCAFTIPTLLESNQVDDDDDLDCVNWKQMETTLPSFNSGDTKENNEIPLYPHSKLDSSLMKTAINDFQIKCKYIFWTSVDSDLAKSLPCEQSEIGRASCRERVSSPV